MFPHEWNALSLRLMETFPGMRFQTSDFWRWVVDPNTARQAQRATHEDLEPPYCLLQPSEEWLFDYRTSLFTPDGSQMIAAVEPPGWHPTFQHVRNGTSIEMTNRPPKSLVVLPSRFENDAFESSYWLPPYREREDEYTYLVPGSIKTSFRADDIDTKRFVSKVWSILNGFLVNSVEIWSIERGVEPSFVADAPKGELIWASAAALDWTTEHPRNFIRVGWLGLKKRREDAA